MGKESSRKSLTPKGLKRAAAVAAGGNPVAQTPQSDSGVPERQWELPVAFCKGYTKPVTLRELVEGAPPPLPFDSLTEEQRTGLVIARILGQRKFSLSVYGVGVINQERAISEVKEGSKIGKSIARVELMMIQEMIDLAKGKGIPPKA